ncbi:hypothetical protein C8J56DRAFT_1062519 [Mycena floridula]|nr:hypothetical protein C8J56DRAFT_1062519 [Mycena floridula]
MLNSLEYPNDHQYRHFNTSQSIINRVSLPSAVLPWTTMLACDGQSCPYQWFHVSCLGLKGPFGNAPWYCNHCTPAAAAILQKQSAPKKVAFQHPKPVGEPDHSQGYILLDELLKCDDMHWDSSTLEDLKSCINNAITLYLDTSKPYKDQSQEKISVVCENVKALFERLNLHHYKECWPVTEWVKIRLTPVKAKRRRKKQSQERSQTPLRLPVTAPSTQKTRSRG